MTLREIRLLVALFQNQPATRRLMSVATSTHETSCRYGLDLLVGRGFVSVTKRTQKRRIDEYGEPLPKRTGKRPYVYELTEKGRLVAEPLALAFRRLEELKKEAA